MNAEKEFAPNCPVPLADYPNILLAHGGGGRLMHQLLEQLVIPTFENELLGARHDGAVLDLGAQRLAFTTDSYVVRPLFFSGGDIGSLAVNGTVNDLAMCGAQPAFLSAGLIIEEGFPTGQLLRVLQSMKEAADQAGVSLVTGDTKVVDRGKGDGIFINTAGIGLIEEGIRIAPSEVRPGDAVLLSGDIGRHGMAIMAAREGLEFETEIESDCACLAGCIRAIIESGLPVHCLRDLTRGGLASALIEIAEAAHLHIHLSHSAIPVLSQVEGACEILGFDPMYVANEGRFICLVPESCGETILQIIRQHPVGESAAIIGHVTEKDAGSVSMTSEIGAIRNVDLLSGEQLPRIC